MGLVAALLAAETALAASEDAVLMLFAGGPDALAGWRTERFDGETDYRTLPGTSEPVVEARARATASGRMRELELDPERYRRIAWSWSVDAPLAVDDARARAGDDFAARVYVVFSGGWAVWRTTSLVYVWGAPDAPAEPWPNPFTSQAMMITATRGLPPPTEDGEPGWVDVERDLVADYRAAFGRSPPEIVAVAIMSDADQTGGAVRGRYARLRLETGLPATQPSAE